MLVGVNGVGKTTTVAKLAAQLKQERGPVIVAAADTFRAAAIEQLEIWCQRVGAEMIKQKAGSDPAAVAFDAVKAAKARKVPTVLIDTAGRLQTKVNLMEELKKIARVIGRELPGAPHETWLVLDANTGQNALSQAKIFADAVPLSGVVLAKLDSTAKGGVVVAIADRLKLPVRFVGVGEELAGPASVRRTRVCRGAVCRRRRRRAAGPIIRSLTVCELKKYISGENAIIMSFEILKQLDERVKAVIERTEQLRQENARLAEQLEEGRRRVEEISAQLQQVEQQCQQHENERLEIKNRIEKLLSRFDGLDLA